MCIRDRDLAAAYALRPENVQGGNWRYKLPAFYANSLSALGKPDRAEKIVRDNLKLPDGQELDARDGYLLLTDSLNDALCRQDRFADSLKMLDEQRQLLALHGGSE